MSEATDVTTTQTKTHSGDIQSLLKSGRNIELDWFNEDASKDRIASSIMAMANSKGGKLLCGIGDDISDVNGIDTPDEIIERIIDAALALDPVLVIPMPQIATIKDKKVVVADIPAGMPHIYSYDGHYLHRQGADNVALKPSALHQLMLRRGKIRFETEVIYGTSLDDIDWEKAEAYAKKLSSSHSGDTKQVLLWRGCLAKVNDTLYPTSAGLLLFGKDPQRYIRGAEITAVRFAGAAMSDTFTRQDILGTLPEQIRKAETFLVDHLRKGVQLKHTMARKEQYEYPLEAVRELVVNAVAHRDYSIDGDGIRLYIFRDHMEISSAGSLPGPVTIDNIKDERFSRNPIIVQVLSDMGYIERLGYGVDRVIELMKNHNLSAPEFIETRGGFKVVLHNKTEEPIKEDKPEAEKEYTDILSEYSDIPLNPRQEGAIVYLNRPDKSRITNSELQQLYPDVHAETIRRDLADLVTKQICSKMGQKRGSYYVLKANEQNEQQDNDTKTDTPANS